MARRGVPFLAGLFTGLLSTALLILLTSEPRGEPIELLPAPTAAPLRVHITGAVRNPGVYELPHGTIVQGALDAAGGATGEAHLSALNLASRLTDGSKIHVPTEQDLTAHPAELVTSSAGAEAGSRLAINEASAADLERLPGIGPTLALAIVQYRDENGPFQSAEDLQNVPGIGPAKVSAIEDLISIP